MDTQYFVFYKEVTSPICTSVAILATVTRLFVRRLVFWFDDVSRFQDQDHLIERTCLTDEYIGMRAIEYVILNCSYGNRPYLKCVANRNSFMATKLWVEPSTCSAYYGLISALFYGTLWWVVMHFVSP